MGEGRGVTTWRRGRRSERAMRAEREGSSKRKERGIREGDDGIMGPKNIICMYESHNTSISTNNVKNKIGKM